MNGLLEILTTKKWMMSPDHIATIRQALEHNLNAHLPFVAERKVMQRFALASGELFRADSDRDDDMDDEGMKATISDPFVNVIYVSGPITRNGGACSYGSVEHRDMIMMAADNDLCRGHVFIINTPGGSAWAKNDYQQAIDYARQKGQPVIAFVDGLCASAGMYLAALCDERYFMHPKDEIGCIGVMAAFYTEKDGNENRYTGETYHELYDPESFDKNREVRDIANGESDQLLIDELAALGVEFRADVKKACPKATDEHLHGKLFNAEDVTGILMDGQSTLGDVIARCFALHEKTNPKTNTTTTMKNYETIAAACGVEALVVTEEGTHLDLSLCDTLEETLAKASADLAEANEQVTNLTAELEKAKAETEQAVDAKAVELNEAHEKDIADLKAEHEKAIAELKAGHEAAIDDAAKAIAEANEAKAQAEADLEGAKAVLATASQTIADRDATIKALTEKPAATPEPSPANNGTGATVQTVNTMPKYDGNKSPEENARIRNEWKRKHGI